jgi:hypothetical protein
MGWFRELFRAGSTAPRQTSMAIGVVLQCDHRSGSYSTDHQGKTECLECYNLRYSYRKDK